MCIRDRNEAERKIKALLVKRLATQPLNLPNAGSTFRNPEGDYAARLIEASGLKGYVMGGAQVSEKHANFIVNLGTATALDIESVSYTHLDVYKRQAIWDIADVYWKIIDEAKLKTIVTKLSNNWTLTAEAIKKEVTPLTQDERLILAQYLGINNLYKAANPQYQEVVNGIMTQSLASSSQVMIFKLAD